MGNGSSRQPTCGNVVCPVCPARGKDRISLIGTPTIGAPHIGDRGTGQHFFDKAHPKSAGVAGSHGKRTLEILKRWRMPPWEGRRAKGLGIRRRTAWHMHGTPAKARQGPKISPCVQRGSEGRLFFPIGLARGILYVNLTAASILGPGRTEPDDGEWLFSLRHCIFLDIGSAPYRVVVGWTKYCVQELPVSSYSSLTLKSDSCSPLVKCPLGLLWDGRKLGAGQPEWATDWIAHSSVNLNMRNPEVDPSQWIWCPVHRRQGRSALHRAPRQGREIITVDVGGLPRCPINPLSDQISPTVGFVKITTPPSERKSFSLPVFTSSTYTASPRPLSCDACDLLVSEGQLPLAFAFGKRGGWNSANYAPHFTPPNIHLAAWHLTFPSRPQPYHLRASPVRSLVQLDSSPRRYTALL